MKTIFYRKLETKILNPCSIDLPSSIPYIYEKKIIMFYSGYSSFKRLGFFFLAIVLMACQENKVEIIEAVKAEIPEIPEVQAVIINEAKDSLLMGINTFNRDPELKNASFAYLIYDATADSIITELNPDLSLMPASTIKLFTTAAALEILGPWAQFKTRLLYTGKIENRILKGNLIIKGGGNPTFGAGEQTMSKVFSAWGISVAQLNIDSITGDIIGDARFFSEDFIPHTWSLDEIHNAAPFGLAIGGNSLRLELDSIGEKSILPKTEKLAPTTPNRTSRNQLANDDEDEPSAVSSAKSQKNKTLGTVKVEMRKPEVASIIRDPALLTATLFRKKLIEKGIRVAGKAKSTSATNSSASKDNSQVRHQIASVGSPSVTSLVHTVNHQSNNFLAETLLKHMGVKKRGYGSSESGIEEVYSFLKRKGIDESGFYMFDGSGVSRFNSLTVNHLVHLLKYMQHSPDSSRFISSLAVAGRSGTMSKMCLNTEAAGNIHGKSGTITRVKSYAGYAQSRSGHTLIFAIIVNNFNCTSVEMRSKIEDILVLMAAL